MTDSLSVSMMKRFAIASIVSFYTFWLASYFGPSSWGGQLRGGAQGQDSRIRLTPASPASTARSILVEW